MEGVQLTIDLKRLAAEVSVQHGIRIDPDDPLLAVVTLNRLVFETAVAQVLDRVQAAVRDFEMAADKVQVRAGSALAQEVRDSGLAMRQEIAGLLEEFRELERPPKIVNHSATRWPKNPTLLIIGFALTLIALACGVWIGMQVR